MHRVRHCWPALLAGALTFGGIASCGEVGDDDPSVATSGSPSTTVATSVAQGTTGETSPSTTRPVNLSEPAGAYEVRDLGTLGGDAAWASDVNEAGQIVGTSKTGAAAGEGRRFEAFVWDPDLGSMRGLGALGPDPHADSTASAINDSGVVVGASGPLDCTEPGCRATRWDLATGRMDDLGTLADPSSGALDVNSAALDINAAGQVVGHSTTSAGEHHAFLWDPVSATMRDLGTLGGSYSEAHGINDRGEVTGVSSTATGMVRAFLWSPETGEMRDIGADRPPEESYDANRINSDASIVGWSAGGTAGFVWWSDGRGLQDLGDRLANDINDGGLIVGSRLTADSTATHLPFVLSGSTGTVAGLPGLAGTTEGSANAVNDLGVIVGAASRRDPQVGPRAVRWSPAA